MILAISFNLAGFGSNELEIISYWTDLTIKLKKKRKKKIQCLGLEQARNQGWKTNLGLYSSSKPFNVKEM